MGAIVFSLSLMAPQMSQAAVDAQAPVAITAKLVGGWFATTLVDGKQRGHWLELRADQTWRRIEDHFGFMAEDHGRWLPDGDGAVLEDVGGVRLHFQEGRLVLVYHDRTLYSFQPCKAMPKQLAELPPFPTTLSETVAILTAELPERERTVLAGTMDEDLVRFHHGLGTYIRNRFGLWGPNPALRAACKVSHPDHASAVILRALRDHLRNTRPGGRELDHLQDVLQDLALGPMAIRQMTLGQLVTVLNHEGQRALRRKGLRQDALLFELVKPGNEDEERKRATYWINYPAGLRPWGQGSEPPAEAKAVELLVGFRKWLQTPNRVMLDPTFDPRFYQPPEKSPDFASVRWHGDWFEVETSAEQGGGVRVDGWSMLGAYAPMSVEQAVSYAASARERVPAGKAPVEISITGAPSEVSQDRWQWSYAVGSRLDASPLDGRIPTEIARASMKRSLWPDLRKPPRLSALAALARFRAALASPVRPEPVSRVEIRLKRSSTSAWYYALSSESTDQRATGYVTLDGRVALALPDQATESPTAEETRK
jgi:hypothetical protein